MDWDQFLEEARIDKDHHDLLGHLIEWIDKRERGHRPLTAEEYGQMAILLTRAGAALMEMANSRRANRRETRA